MGFTQAKTHDIEVWAPGVQEWLEVSSVSNFRDFQARRMNIRWRPSATDKPEILHTLNGSSLGFPRTVAALLETYQQPDGTVALPEPLASAVGPLTSVELARARGRSRLAHAAFADDERLPDVARAFASLPIDRPVTEIAAVDRVFRCPCHG